MVGDEGRMRLCGRSADDAGHRQVGNWESGQKRMLDSHVENRIIWLRVSMGWALI